MLAPLPGADRVVARFLGVATRWTTATPVVQPGHDHRHGKPRPERSVARLLRHTGIDPGLVASVTMEPQARLVGSEGAHRYRRPAHLAAPSARRTDRAWESRSSGVIGFSAFWPSTARSS